MIQLINMVAQSSPADHGGRRGRDAGKFIRDCGCDGMEIIYNGSEEFCSSNKDMISGYHLMFYADWLDFWHKDEAALNRKYGSEEIWKGFYGGSGRSSLIGQLHADLLRAESLDARYVVFHVSDVSSEEVFTYRWEHTDEEVIDAAAQLINLLLDGQNYQFDFLMENLHWPGFNFTRPEMTERLLSRVNYKRKGIMLDTGHLMCTNLEIRDQDDGIRYIHRMLNEHGALSRYIRGVHLHQSVTGEYVKQTLSNPPALKVDFYKKFKQAYEHIGRIDTHQPISSTGAYHLVERIAPEYLVHEISAGTLKEKKDLIKIQQNSITVPGGIL